MKEIKEEADRLVELYIKENSSYDVYYAHTLYEVSVNCAIIDVSNTIEVLRKFYVEYNLKDEWFDSVQRELLEFNKRVKTELEARLNK